VTFYQALLKGTTLWPIALLATKVLTKVLTFPSASFPTDGTSGPQVLRVSQILSALSYALDLTEGQPMGHSVRACIIGMRIAQHIGLPLEDQGDLYYSLLLKDAGCSSNASRLFHILSADEIRAKGDVKTTDWTKVGWDSLQYAISHVATGAPFLERVRTLLRVAVTQQRDSCELVKIRCERGSSVARRMGFSENVAAAIFSLDEHWNGGGYPDGLRGKQIPLYSRIMNLAQTLEVFLVNKGAETAVEVARQRGGRWFDPDLVRAAESLHQNGGLFADLGTEKVLEDVVALEPEARQIAATEGMLDGICMAFADVIDAKSPFTYRHSNGVAAAAVAIGQQLDLSPSNITFLRRAALLHDIGKLSVSNSILEKPGKLTNEEFEIVKKHPYYTFEILKRIPGFAHLSEIAASHHEKLDGSGYFRGYGAEQMPLASRILVVADIYDALAAKRPYRDAMPVEQVFSILGSEAPIKLDAECLEALTTAQKQGHSLGHDLQALANVVSGPVVPISKEVKV
jgi:putative nucleotidyltransferase with HDIG domain